MSKWIDAIVSMPEVGDDVLVARSGYRDLDICYLDRLPNGVPCFTMSLTDEFHVVIEEGIYWMPLPEPPDA